MFILGVLSAGILLISLLADLLSKDGASMITLLNVVAITYIIQTLI